MEFFSSVSDKARHGWEFAKNKVAAVKSAAVEKARAVTKATLDKISEWADKRNTYEHIGGVVQRCGKSVPNPNDGKFMGRGCELGADKPEQGQLPKGCKPGCALPKVVFTNGINTSEADLCKTMAQLAESRCAEVVGIFNSSFANDHVSGDGVGLLQDVIRARETINGSASSAATTTLAKMLVQQLSEDSTDPITIYAHSEGGLNTRAALVSAKATISAQERKKARDAGYSPAEARIIADKATETKIARITVTSMGTAADGWPPGPTYKQYENSLDLVPKVISAAEFADNQHPNTPPNARLSRHKFTRISTDPLGHGVNKIYLEELDRYEKVKKSGADGGCC